MRPIPMGTKGHFELVVEPHHLASQFKDVILPSVFATPMMVLVMENAALNAVREFLDSGEAVLGTGIDVRHVAATPVTAFAPKQRLWTWRRNTSNFALRLGTKLKKLGAERTNAWLSI